MAIDQITFTTPGTQSWTVPTGVTSICAVVIGGGASGGSNYPAGSGGGGGGLAYTNDIPVTPGEVLTVVVGAGGAAQGRSPGSAGNGGTSKVTRSGTSLVEASGGVIPGSFVSAGGVGGQAIVGTGFSGGRGGYSTGYGVTYDGVGGGGAAGYLANGGNGGNSAAPVQYGTGGSGSAGRGSLANGGGVGVFGLGPNPTDYSQGGSGGIGQVYGGGGGGRSTDYYGTELSNAGGNGAVRIVWGAGVSFPYSASDVVIDTVLPDATQDVAYSTTITATGGTAPYVFSASSTLPSGLTLSSNGVLSGTPTLTNSYTFTVSVIDANNIVNAKIIPLNVLANVDTIYPPGTYTLTIPSNASVMSVVAVGGGGGGATGASNNATGGAGGGGGLAYKNNISVTPGDVYQLVVGAGGALGTEANGVSGWPGQSGGSSSLSFGGTTLVLATGGVYGRPSAQGGGGSPGAFAIGDGGGNGGTGSGGVVDSGGGGGGGGAGGYGGAGGNGGSYGLGAFGYNTPSTAGAFGGGGGGGGGGRNGGGVGLYGIGPNGAGGLQFPSGSSDGSPGSGGSGKLYGGGGAGSQSSHGPGFAGGNGAVRIVWNVATAFSSTLVTTSFTTSSLSTANGGVSYSATLNTPTGVAPFTYSITAGSLPTGLSLNSTTGVISGTPTGSAPATYSFNIRAASANGSFDTASFTLALDLDPVELVTTSLPAILENSSYSVTLQTTGGLAPLTFTRTSGTLPTGLTLNPTTGEISGSVTTLTSSTYTFSIRVSSINGSQDTVSYTILVAAAGRGALVDGSVMDPTSKEASMLFNGVTFITPSVDALVMTNGVRVEWINSFTYYANRGLYATNGTLGFAGLATKFGAEVRSIGSANIYGNYGAVADGDETKMYLVSHNFAYIGAGEDYQNDTASVIQANEVVESNNGHIYYESIDQIGNFRIGDIFYVEQSTGVVNLNAQAINFLATGYIVLESPSSTTIIDATKVQTGNIKIYDNTIEATSGPINFLAQSGSTRLNTDVTVTGNLDITGSINVDGNVFLGDNPLDTVTIIPYLTQTIEPDQTDFYSLGNNTDPKVWNRLFASTGLNVDNITSIGSNTITTLASGTDLRLVAAGTGIIDIVSTDVVITNNLTVNGTAVDTQFFANVGITGLLSVNGDWDPTGDVDRTGNTNITGTLTINGVNTVSLADIDIAGNNIITTALDTDLELAANGTGLVKTMTSDVEITNDLEVLTDIYLGVTNITTSIEATTFTIGDIDITANSITTYAPNINLELIADGQGLIHVLTTDVEITNNLTVNGTVADAEFADVGITGLLDITGDWDPTGDSDRTGDTDITGTLTVNGVHTVDLADIQVSGNTITTTALNTDLELAANGLASLVKTLTSNVEITNDLEVILDSEFGVTNVTTTVEATTFTVGDIDITANSITTHAPNINLLLSADGNGEIHVKTTDVVITNDLEVNGTVTNSQLADVGITGLLDITGDWEPTGNVDRTGDTDITGTLTVNGPNTVQFEDIQVLGNTITTTVSNNALELNANGLASLVKTLTSDVEITNDLDVILDGEFGSANVTLGVELTDLDTANIHIVNNTITSDTNLELKAFTGQEVHFVTSDVYIPNDLTIAGPATFNGDSTLLSVEIDGDTTIIGDLNQTVGDTYITGNFNNNNILIEAPSYIEVPDIKIYDNIISVTALNTDLEFRAAGTGGIVFDRQLKINTNIISNVFDVNNLALSFNNLYLAEDGQLLLTEDGDNYLLDVKNDRDLSVIFEPNGIGNVVVNSNKAIAVAYGNASNRTLEYLGEIRQNSTSKRYEGFVPDGIVSFSNIADTDGNTYITPELTPGANDNTLRFAINNVVTTRVTETEMFSNRLTVDNVTISGTTVSNLNSTADLILTGNGTGNVLFNTIAFKSNTIINTENNALILSSTGTGYIKFTGTAGLVLPVGGDAGRNLTPEVAETRFNTDSGYVEIFNGTDWTSLRGSASTATEEEIATETNLWAFVLG